MRYAPVLSAVLASAVVASPAAAMDRYGQVRSGARNAVADPDARLERLAAASTPNDSGHGRPVKSARSILKDDASLRAAFAWLDNK